MEKEDEKMEYQIKNLKEEINILRGRQSTLWGVCIVLTSSLVHPTIERHISLI